MPDSLPTVEQAARWLLNNPRALQLIADAERARGSRDHGAAVTARDFYLAKLGIPTDHRRPAIMQMVEDRLNEQKGAA